MSVESRTEMAPEIEDKIDASFSRGVLEIRIPGTKESMGRKIAIDVP